MLMTLPPGSACLAASLFELMSGLKLPRHRRRTTRRVRADFMLVALEESPTPSSAASPCVPEVNPCGVSGLWTFR